MKKKQKHYKTAPLPFQGQKRMFVSRFKEALSDFPPNGVYVDLFGGSGLLSHTVRTTFPNATVIYNDYDNFSKRLHAIPRTNKILDQLRKVVTVPNKSRINETQKKLIITVLENEDKKGFVDYITLSANLLFSG